MQQHAVGGRPPPPRLPPVATSRGREDAALGGWRCPGAQHARCCHCGLLAPNPGAQSQAKWRAKSSERPQGPAAAVAATAHRLSWPGATPVRSSTPLPPAPALRATTQSCPRRGWRAKNPVCGRREVGDRFAACSTICSAHDRAAAAQACSEQRHGDSLPCLPAGVVLLRLAQTCSKDGGDSVRGTHSGVADRPKQGSEGTRLGCWSYAACQHPPLLSTSINAAVPVQRGERGTKAVAPPTRCAAAARCTETHPRLRLRLGLCKVTRATTCNVWLT